MTVTVTFNVTMNPSIATESEAPRPATQACFMGYVSEGKILSGNAEPTTENPLVTNDEIVFKDSDALNDYLAEIGPDPLNDGYTISNYVVS